MTFTILAALHFFQEKPTLRKTDYTYTAGLCAVCANVQIVESPRGPVYFLCGLSKINPVFAKYPQLPVLRCPGYRPHELDENADPQSSDDSTG